MLQGTSSCRSINFPPPHYCCVQATTNHWQDFQCERWNVYLLGPTGVEVFSQSLQLLLSDERETLNSKKTEADTLFHRPIKHNWTCEGNSSLTWECFDEPHCVTDLVKGGIAVRAVVVVLTVGVTVLLLSDHLHLPHLVFLQLVHQRLDRHHHGIFQAVHHPVVSGTAVVGCKHELPNGMSCTSRMLFFFLFSMIVYNPTLTRKWWVKMVFQWILISMHAKHKFMLLPTQFCLCN